MTITGIYARFSGAASRFGERTAVEVERRGESETWTYGRLHARAEELAASLSANGVGRGDRCALLADNDAQWCAAFLGILRLGAVAVPLDTTYTSSQVSRLISDCGARIALVSPRFREVVECRSIVLQGAPGSTETSTADLPDVTVDPKDTAVILYTSGTTSDPKGVVLTHANLLAEIDAALDVITFTEADAVLSVLPLFHALALLANLLLPLTLGARVVFLDTVSSGELLRTFQEREITAFCCVPQFFHLIHQRVMEQVAGSGPVRRLAFRIMLLTAGVLRDRAGINVGRVLFARIHHALGRHMRLLVTGGSRLDPGVGRDLYRLGFNLLQAYGLTESSGAATVLRPGDRHVGSVGQALPGVELAIVPPEDETAAGAADHDLPVGEIAIRGPIVSTGYFQRPDANAVAFRDGWLHTGDLGYLDAAGRLYITGRAKDVIVLGSGKNIHPEEIEAHYIRSPYIKELCVVGKTSPADALSERLHGVVVPDFEVLRARNIFNSREIIRFEIENLSAQLPGHKRIMSYEVVTDDLPRTTTRKLKRFEIERRLGGGQESAGAAEPEVAESASDDAWAEDPQVEPILRALRESSRTSAPVRRSSSLELDLGLDSMGRVELLAGLEARLGVSLPDDGVQGIHTVGDLVDAIRLAGGARRADDGTDLDAWTGILEDVSEDDEAVAPILIARPVLNAALFTASRLLYGMAYLLMGLRVSGREHLPDQGPFLVSPNHQSFLDAFLLVSALPFRVFRNTFYVGASEYFETPFRAWIARMIHVVPVDPDSNLVRAMRAGALGLRRGKILILFPEGERSIDDTVKTFKKGAAILSQRTGAPIVPVAMDGMYDLWPRAGRPRLSRLLPFSGARTHIRFGPPLVPSGEARHAQDTYTAVTQRLRDSVESMLLALRTERVDR